MEVFKTGMQPLRILFVCMGNICRSPSAEAVFLSHLRSNALEEAFEVASAGTHGYHIGDPADSRSIVHAQKRGIDLTFHRAQKVQPGDFEYYDYILAMDNTNFSHLKAICPHPLRRKLYRFCEFATESDQTEVPDPYYGGEKGFELVLDLLEDASKGFLKYLQTKQRG